MGYPVTALTRKVMSSLMPDSDDAAQLGDFFVELVEPDPGQRDEITDLLRPVFGNTGGMIAEFITMSNPVSDSPSSAFPRLVSMTKRQSTFVLWTG